MGRLLQQPNGPQCPPFHLIPACSLQGLRVHSIEGSIPVSSPAEAAERLLPEVGGSKQWQKLLKAGGEGEPTVVVQNSPQLG